ncbi:MAG: heme-binding protein [Acidobacteria bacterium]|nr:heme-binding protein [Acidobacteriota bacterium]
MHTTLTALIAIGLAAGPADRALAQGVVMQRNLLLGMAKTIAEATLAACTAKGYNTSVAVVDRAAQVLVIMRSEQATAQTADMARRKAYTARMFRVPAAEFQKRTEEDPARYAQRDLADILALGGGVPIQVGNDTIGAVGSAGSTLDTDAACAKAGIAAVADLLK